MDRFGKAKLSQADRDVGTSSRGTDETDPFTDERDNERDDERDAASGPSTSNPLKCTKLPASIQQSMWAKVTSYLEDNSSYSKSPGVNDYTSVLVKLLKATLCDKERLQLQMRQ